MALPVKPPATASSPPCNTACRSHLLPETYILIPKRLLEDLRDTPAALGVYSLVARIFMITGAPVPLSPGDLQSYDPALSYGAARRALERLSAIGYIAPQALSGQKQGYLPTWGLVHDHPVVWDRTTRSLGRPRHIQAIRLDDRLLDICIGRIRPHAVHRAIVERFLVTPLLSLRDLGAYALALVGIVAQSPALQKLGLIDSNHRALPLPDEHTILNIATQRASGDDALTPAGWQRIGLLLKSPMPTTEQTLFFAPIGAIGDMIASTIGNEIGQVIGCQTVTRSHSDASQCDAGSSINHATGSHGITEMHGIDRESTTPLDQPAGGGSTQSVPSRTRGRKVPADGESGVATNPSAQAPELLRVPPHTRTIQVPESRETSVDTSSAQRLCAFGIRTDVANSLANRPLTQIEHVIAQAQARKEVRDRAGWVVSALRKLPISELPPSVMPVNEHDILFHPTISGYERQQWLGRFRRAEATQRPEILRRFLAAHPLENNDGATTEPAP